MDTLHLTSPSAYSSTDDGLIKYDDTIPYSLCEENMSPYTNSAANYPKNGHSMKSPLIIYNHCHQKGVLQSALLLRQDLEMRALELKKRSGSFIRPIALIVLKSQTLDNESELKKIKQGLIDDGIEERYLKIKTNAVDELPGVDLLDEVCEVRYIITLANLKERLRCPFLYVIASLEERAKVTDLTNLLNCMLPVHDQPGTMDEALNAAYIITASSKFEHMLHPLRIHLYNLGCQPDQFIAVNKMVELLKGMSVWEVLDNSNWSRTGSV